MNFKNEPIRSVAVLCAAYNGIRYLDQQLLSIIRQEGMRVAIYLSVDISSDGTFELCKAWALKNADIVVLEYGETFGGAAKNFFRLIRDVDFSQYDYVALADQDDIWFSNKLHRAITSIENRQVDAYSSNVIAFWPDGTEKLIIKSQPQTEYDFLFQGAGPGCTYVFKSRALVSFKSYVLKNEQTINNIAFHDWALYAFFRSRNKSWFIDPTPGMRYRQHATNQLGANSGLKEFSKRFFMVKKKWYKKEVEKIVALAGDSLINFSLNRFFLIKNFWKLRRRMKNKLFLLFFLLVGLF